MHHHFKKQKYDELIKITPYNPKPLMPICLEELAWFPGELGPICPQEPKKHVCQRNLGPFASCNHIFPRNLAHLPSTTRFPREFGPICFKQPHILEGLDPFPLGTYKSFSPQGSWGNLVRSPSQGGWKYMSLKGTWLRKLCKDYI